MKIVYSEYVLNVNLDKEVSLDGAELKSASDMAIRFEWNQIKDYYFKLLEMGLVDKVVEDTGDNMTTLHIVSEIDNGSQYHRVFTKYNK